MIDILEKLIKDKVVTLSDSADLICGDAVNTSIYGHGDSIIIKFMSPFVYLIVKKLGSINIVDIKRKVDSIRIDKENITVVVDNFPDISKSRKELFND